MLETKQKGIITELQCITAFNEFGFKVSIPYGENSRYDFIVDINNHLLKVQAKTASGVLNENSEVAGIKFACRSTRVNAQGNQTRRYTKDEIDYFCTFWNGICYVVPVEETSQEKTLRFFYPNSGQKAMISLAEDYTIEKQWKKFLNEDDDFEKVKSNFEKTLSKIEKTGICKMCGKPITKGCNYCVECSHILQRTVERPSRDELKILIRNTPFTTIGKQFGVTDNTIRKWCIGENLPSKVTDIKKYSDEEWNNI